MKPTLTRAACRGGLLTLLAWAAGPAHAQQPAQKVSPPVAQAWIDSATFSGLNMPMGGGGGPGGGNPMAALGSLFGRGDTQNVFGNTRAAGAGRYVDVTLLARPNPGLADAQQAVPAGFLPSALKLQAQPESKPVGDEEDTGPLPEMERPKGRLLLYWGCGASVRNGQPQVLDMATASAADIGKFFQARHATQRGAHAAPGRPVWPSKADARMVPAHASIAGEHAFSGQGVPEGFRFQIPAGHDLMPPLGLQQTDAGGATELRWSAAPNARAYFASAMGANDKQDIILWTSSELPDSGMGLMDYQTNAAVDRWLREKVLLAPTTTSCTVPKGIFPGQGAMLRVIGYGNELNLAHPPRPTDPKQPWNPEWAVKLRAKSVASAMLGMPDMGHMMGGRQPQGEPERDTPPPKEDKPAAKALDLLKGILGR
jgi:hypothetical protein